MRNDTKGWNHLMWNSFLPTTGTRYYYYSEQRRPFLLFLVVPGKRCQQSWMLVMLCLRSTELLFLLIILTEWVYNPPTSTCLFEDNLAICVNVMLCMSWVFLGTYDRTHYQWVIQVGCMVDFCHSRSPLELSVPLLHYDTFIF